MAEIKDFGKKIGGARKDLWKTYGLSLEDIQNLNEAEHISNGITSGQRQMQKNWWKKAKLHGSFSGSGK